jgi:hypothetical protein
MHSKRRVAKRRNHGRIVPTLDTPSAEPTGDQALPNSIVALAASRFVASCVTNQETAGLVAAVALWSLREMGAVDFRSWEYERWWWPWQPGSALVVGIVSPKDVGPSLEQELLNQVRMLAAGPHKGPDLWVRVYDVIYEWLGDEYTNPHDELLLRVSERATTAGWYELTRVPRRSGVTRFLFGPRLVHVPNSARAAAIELRAQTLADEWQRFRSDENFLSSWLIETVAKAIRNRTYQSYAD